MPGKANKLGRQYGWQGWVVPSDLLADELFERSVELKDYDRHPHDNQPESWRGTLAARAAKILGVTDEAVVRRLYDVLHGKSRIVNATIAEALMLAVGVYMDRESDLPTLPGCVTSAVEMVDVHADIYDESMTKLEKKRLASSLMNFSVGFIYFDDAFVTEQEATEAVCKALAAAGRVEAPERELVAA